MKTQMIGMKKNDMKTQMIGMKPKDAIELKKVPLLEN